MLYSDQAVGVLRRPYTRRFQATGKQTASRAVVTRPFFSRNEAHRQACRIIAQFWDDSTKETQKQQAAVTKLLLLLRFVGSPIPKLRIHSAGCRWTILRQKKGSGNETSEELIEGRKEVGNKRQEGGVHQPLARCHDSSIFAIILS